MRTYSDCNTNFVPATLVDLLQWRACHQPDQRAYTFLVDGEAEEVHLTYRGLDSQARTIGALLQSLGEAGERALLLYPPGLEFISAFFGCLYAGIVAVPAYPPHPAQLHRTHPRLRAIAEDARPLFVLSTSRTQPTHRDSFLGMQNGQQIYWCATDRLDDDLVARWQAPAITGETLAFLQYTSGSTTIPKGVMVSHRNLLQNSANLDRGWEHTPNSVLVSWLPYFHDMGLIYGLIQPLYKGFTCVLMAPASFTQQPIRWLQAISRYKATHSAAPNFAYDLCVRKVTPAQRETLELSRWEVALNGAEPIREATLERFTRTFEPCGFRWNTFCPGYGLAEATLKVSATHKRKGPVLYTVQAAALERNQVVTACRSQPDARTLVSSGTVALDTRIVIVHPDTRTPCAPDEVGEIWVSGASVAQGYWNRPDQTVSTFRSYLADTGDGPFLRTGDLGFIKDGELFVTGRLKDMIIIDGRNHYPQDIEYIVEQSHPSLRPNCCAAFSIEIDGEERLVIVAEVDRHYRPYSRVDGEGGLGQHQPLDAKVMLRAIRRAVVEHNELQAHAIVLVKFGSVPKTSSGKLQRHACQASFLAGTLEIWGE